MVLRKSWNYIVKKGAGFLSSLALAPWSVWQCSAGCCLSVCVSRGPFHCTHSLTQHYIKTETKKGEAGSFNSRTGRSLIRFCWIEPVKCSQWHLTKWCGLPGPVPSNSSAWPRRATVPPKWLKYECWESGAQLMSPCVYFLFRISLHFHIVKQVQAWNVKSAESGVLTALTGVCKAEKGLSGDGKMLTDWACQGAFATGGTD